MRKKDNKGKLAALAIAASILGACVNMEDAPAAPISEPIPVEDLRGEEPIITITKEPIPAEEAYSEIGTDTISAMDEEMEHINSLADLECSYVVRANETVKIRRSEIDGEEMGLLYAGNTLPTNGMNDYGWYEVKYNGEIGYVSGEYVTEEPVYNFPYEYSKVVYVVEDTTIYCDDEKTEEAILPANEVAEVYGEDDEYYLVQTNDFEGYIPKVNTRDMTGTFVVVDLSDQTLKLYSDNQTIIDTLVVTGKPSTPTIPGYFKIQSEEYNRKLKNRWFVNVFMPFDGGRGLHDAEYFTEESGYHHGWRTADEFGGNTHLTNGSHGCVNMRHNDAIKASEYLEPGDVVIVKK